MRVSQLVLPKDIGYANSYLAALMPMENEDRKKVIDHMSPTSLEYINSGSGATFRRCRKDQGKSSLLHLYGCTAQRASTAKELEVASAISGTSRT